MTTVLLNFRREELFNEQYIVRIERRFQACPVGSDNETSLSSGVSAVTEWLGAVVERSQADPRRWQVCCMTARTNCFWAPAHLITTDIDVKHVALC